MTAVRSENHVARAMTNPKDPNCRGNARNGRDRWANDAEAEEAEEATGEAGQGPVNGEEHNKMTNPKDLATLNPAQDEARKLEVAAREIE